MKAETIEELIRTGMPDAEVTVTGDDGEHFEAVVVSPAFAGKTLIQKHRMVMATVDNEIRNGELHALSIKTFTPEERAAQGS